MDTTFDLDPVGAGREAAPASAPLRTLLGR